jgi:hypothetical protein
VLDFATPEPTSTDSSPVITAINRRFQTTWEPATDPGTTEKAIRSSLEDAGAVTLLPENLPAGATGSTGRLTISEMVPTGLVRVDVYVSFTRDGREESLSLTRGSTNSGVPSCDERITEGAGGLSGWTTVSVRSSTGCAVTNEVGLGFIEWDDRTSRYHVETWMSIEEVLAWLDTWRVLP